MPFAKSVNICYAYTIGLFVPYHPKNIMNLAQSIKIGTVLVLILVVSGFGWIVYQNIKVPKNVNVLGEPAMLHALWSSYKEEYWESSTGRTLDKQQNNITTSEGQSYMLLRAVWNGDKDTFDRAWGWSKVELKRPNDNLFAWKWGQRADKTYGLLTEQGGNNTASDADTDIALALIMAAARWQDKNYLIAAQQIIQDIWKYQVFTINGTPYLMANDIERLSETDKVVNVSYFAPYAYRIFKNIDPANDWNALVDSSYRLIEKTSSSALGASKNTGLPPNWILLNKTTGDIEVPPASTGLSTDFGYDAIRTVWRLSLDYQWYKDDRAKTQLRSFSFLYKEWSNNNAIFTEYAKDETARSRDENLATYGTTLGYFMLADPAIAKQIYDAKLKAKFDPTENQWFVDPGYYADNWAWFGMALYLNQLPNLTTTLLD